MAGLDPAIGDPNQIANDAIPVSTIPIETTGSSPIMTGLDRCVRYVNSKGLGHQSQFRTLVQVALSPARCRKPTYSRVCIAENPQ